MPTFFKQQMTPKSVEKRDTAKATAAAWRKLVKAVMERDKFRCRICRKSNLKLDPHHIVFKSAGGADRLANLVAACRICHDQIHLHKIYLSGTATKLRIER